MNVNWQKRWKKFVKTGWMWMLFATLLCCSACGESMEEKPAYATQYSLAETEVATTEAKAESNELLEAYDFVIQFIDVGQADAALIECEGHYMLIDGGNKADSDIIYTVLERNQITHLDAVVGTHAHEDHIGGLAGALNFATADVTYCPVTEYESKAFQDFKSYAELNGNGLTVPSVGDCFSLGSADVQILGVNSGTDTNNTSIVLKITYGDTSFLFAADAEYEAEEVILDAGFDLKADVLKVGHHGSDTSTSYPFLREIMPDYAVISVGEGNSYGHPTEETLSRLRDAEVQVLRTDQLGDIFCISDGTTVSFSQEDVMKAMDETDSTISSEPETNSYVFNTNTKKFHLPTCKKAEQISEKNKEEFTGTREDVISMGYEPCGICEP